MTITEFFSELDSLTLGKFSNQSNTRKLEWLNVAIINLYSEVKNYVPTVYNKESTITLVDGVGNLPSDINLDDYGNFLLFQDARRRIIIPINNYDVFGNTVRFGHVDSSTIYIEYSKQPTEYTSVDSELLEANIPRVKRLLKTELEYIRDTAIYQGQASGQSQAARIRTQEQK